MLRQVPPTTSSSYANNQYITPVPTVLTPLQIAQANGQSTYDWGQSKTREAANIARNWTKALEETVRHVCDPKTLKGKDVSHDAVIKDWKIDGSLVKEVYKHQDHYHLVTEDGKEHFMSTDPSSMLGNITIKDYSEIGNSKYLNKANYSEPSDKASVEPKTEPKVEGKTVQGEMPKAEPKLLQHLLQFNQELQLTLSHQHK